MKMVSAATCLTSEGHSHRRSGRA
ncbi:MAG: hypothetical protein QOE54_4011, partial [Streptosporangiaceae bacterium]|nr:hypothetical protein [Streptosporangiaceae bacterium]